MIHHVLKIYSSIDKNKLPNTTRLCAKCKYTLYDMIETPNYDDIIPFEKCLYIGLVIPSKITNNEKQTTLRNIDIYFVQITCYLSRKSI